VDDEITRLGSFPRNKLLGQELCSGKVGELALLERLGPPTATTDPVEDDPRFYWDLEFPCGLVTSLEFHQISERLYLSLDGPDIDHALRHLGVELADVSLLEDTDPDRYAQVVPSIERDWEVWREGPNGAVEMVAAGLTERDAECRRDRLERSALGTVHWVQRAE